jgi:hypothetical protein
MPAAETTAGAAATRRGGRREGAGRKSKRTQALERGLCKAVEQGLSVARACALVGIHPDTYSDWCTKDPSLELKIEAARSRGISKALAKLEREKDWRATTWLLEKLDRATYGPAPALVAANQQNNYLLGGE